MKSTDRAAFAETLGDCMTFYEKVITPSQITIWFTSLQPYELAAVQAAFGRYITDPNDCRFPPKPGDIIRHIQSASADDGRPGADEAWGLLLRVIRDEHETGVLTDEMRAGWTACQPILALGDEVGARRCFLEVYARHVAEARQRQRPARWTVTLGTCPQLRAQRLTEAMQANRLSRDQITALLPGPTPASLDQVAGLLEGPGSTRKDADTAQRLRALAAMLRSSSAEAEARRAAERQRQREQETEKKREIKRLIDQHANNGRDAA